MKQPPPIVTLFLLLFSLQLSIANAGTTTVILTGDEQFNTFKQSAAEKFVTNLGDYVSDLSDHDIIVLHNGPTDTLLNHQLVRQIPNVKINFNITTLVLTGLGFDAMSIDQLAEMEQFVRTERALLFVEMGKTTRQAGSLLEHHALCWATTRLTVQSPNTVRLCNSLDVRQLESIMDLSELDSITDFDLTTEQPRPFWPCLFASAAKTEKKLRKVKVEEIIVEDIDDEVDDILERVQEAEKKKGSAEDDDDGNEFDNAHDPKRDHRVHCKYRKSCYETGKLGLIEPFDFTLDHIFHFWRVPPSQHHESLPKTQDADGDGIPDAEDEDVNLADRKLSCKYRPSCYKKNDIPLSDKLREREESRSFISSKLHVPTGKKKTLKDIAKKTVNEVKEQEERAKARPLSNSFIVEKKLQEIEDQLQKKIDCKYRKSCYESGQLPEIEPFASVLPSFSVFSSSSSADEDDEEEKPFEELEEDEKKVFCKYRKSCYDTGKKPEIEAEILVENIGDLFEIPQYVETRKQTVQERCKYRKSCYETGILPDLGGKSEDELVDKIADKQVNKIVPSNVNDLKSLCKYRKSCYVEVAASETPDIVQSIRKRHVIEREVKKRRATQHRHRHRKHHYRHPEDSEEEVKTFRELESSEVEKTQAELEAEKSTTGKKIVKEIEEPKVELKKAAKKPSEPKKENKDEVPEKVKKSSKTEEKTKKSKATPVPPPVPVVEESSSEEVEQVKKEVKPVKSTKKVDEKKVESKNKKTKAVPVPVPEDSTSEEEKVAVQKKSSKKTPQQKKKAAPEPVSDESEEVPVPKKTTKKTTQHKNVSPSVKERDDSDEEAPKKPSKTEFKKVVTPEPNSDESEEKPQPPKKSSKQDLKKKTVVKEESSEEVPAPKKNLKKSQKVEVEPKVEVKKVEKEKAEKVEDDGNEFDNAHDPKRDHRLHCKYRKSCYETGELGLIEPFDFTLDHIFHFWRAPPSQHHVDYHKQDSDGDGIPDSKDDDVSLSERKLMCKYRPSCYADNEIPISEHIVKRAEMKTEAAVKPSGHRHQQQDDSDEDDYEDDGIDKSSKLTCKYRKSCYESGVLPEINQLFAEPEIPEPILSYKDDKLNRCKYRKSCYKDAGIADGEDDVAEKEEERAHHKTQTPVVEKAKIVKEVHKHEQKKQPSKKQKQSSENEDNDDSDESEEDEKEQKSEKKVTEPVGDTTEVVNVHLHADEKLSCKYRKACYSSIKPRALNQDHSGTIARTGSDGQRLKCHQYYYSCREQLGLPPKEKAPIGPNGKRLCRRKTPPTTAAN